MLDDLHVTCLVSPTYPLSTYVRTLQSLCRIAADVVKDLGQEEVQRALEMSVEPRVPFWLGQLSALMRQARVTCESLAERARRGTGTTEPSTIGAEGTSEESASKHPALGQSAGEPQYEDHASDTSSDDGLQVRTHLMHSSTLNYKWAGNMFCGVRITSSLQHFLIFFEGMK
jgi:hypothetical protein